MTKTESRNPKNDSRQAASTSSKHDRLPKGYHLLAKRLGKLIADTVIKSNRKIRATRKPVK